MTILPREQSALMPHPQYRRDRRRTACAEVHRNAKAAAGTDMLPPAERDLQFRQQVPSRAFAERDLAKSKQLHHRRPDASPPWLRKRLSRGRAPEHFLGCRLDVQRKPDPSLGMDEH